VAPAFTEFEAVGFYAPAGYFIIPKKPQLIAKWERFDPGQKLHQSAVCHRCTPPYKLKLTTG
jgi:hypothetical protein